MPINFHKMAAQQMKIIELFSSKVGVLKKNSLVANLFTQIES
jgi:hypothetical protein